MTCRQLLGTWRLLLAFFLVLPAHALENQIFECTTPGEVVDYRVIAIEYQDQQAVPCRTYYTKNGNKDQIATADYTAGVCEDVAKRVLANLKSAGFACEAQLLRNHVPVKASAEFTAEPALPNVASPQKDPPSQ